MSSTARLPLLVRVFLPVLFCFSVCLVAIFCVSLHSCCQDASLFTCLYTPICLPVFLPACTVHRHILKLFLIWLHACQLDVFVRLPACLPLSLYISVCPLILQCNVKTQKDTQRRLPVCILNYKDWHDCNGNIIQVCRREALDLLVNRCF